MIVSPDPPKVSETIKELRNEIDKSIINKYEEAKNEFFIEIARMVLGREPDMEKDAGRFNIITMMHNDKTLLAFDGTQIGEIQIDYTNGTFEFTSYKPFKK